ncbi:hypothetical protein GBAR_LOCUS21769, partial [Geodia barretti]
MGNGSFSTPSLVTEFQEPSRHEYKLQVLANLAKSLRSSQLEFLDNSRPRLFLDVMAEDKDEQMVNLQWE